MHHKIARCVHLNYIIPSFFYLLCYYLIWRDFFLVHRSHIIFKVSLFLFCSLDFSLAPDCSCFACFLLLPSHISLQSFSNCIIIHWLVECIVIQIVINSIFRCTFNLVDAPISQRIKWTPKKKMSNKISYYNIRDIDCLLRNFNMQ